MSKRILKVRIHLGYGHSYSFQDDHISPQTVTSFQSPFCCSGIVTIVNPLFGVRGNLIYVCRGPRRVSEPDYWAQADLGII